MTLSSHEVFLEHYISLSHFCLNNAINFLNRLNRVDFLPTPPHTPLMFSVPVAIVVKHLECSLMDTINVRELLDGSFQIMSSVDAKEPWLRMPFHVYYSLPTALTGKQSSVQFTQQAVQHWVLFSEGEMLSGLGWLTQQTGKNVWSRHLRAPLHVARSTATEQDSPKELINFVDKDTEDAPCSPVIPILCCCQRPAFWVSPRHLYSRNKYKQDLAGGSVWTRKLLWGLPTVHFSIVSWIMN